MKFIIPIQNGSIEVYVESNNKQPSFVRFMKRKYLQSDWSIQKDVDDVDMVCYKNIPVDEIIYCVGEMFLSHNTEFPIREYYDGDTYRIALDLATDTDFSREFYTQYSILNDNYEQYL